MYAHDESWWGFFQRALPDYEMEVALIAWFGGIQVRPPPDEYLELLLHRTERPLTEEERETLHSSVEEKSEFSSANNSPRCHVLFCDW